MVWGTPGFTDRLDGASGKSWELTFERRLAPRPGHAENPASSVWLVRDASTGRFYAAKRQSVQPDQVDSLRDEAAAWRSSSLICPVMAELVDVFVARTPPSSVTFLHEFCARGHIPKEPPSEQTLLSIIADLADAAASVARATHAPHANISYDNVLVDENGRPRLAGFGAQRSARLLAPGPAPRSEVDTAAIGALALELALGRAVRDRAPPPDALPYSSRVADFVIDLSEALESQMHPAEAAARAHDLGGVPGASVIDVSARSSSNLYEADSGAPSAPDVERAVDKLTTGIDAAGAYSAVIFALKRDAKRASGAIFKSLQNCPIAHDPLCTMRALTMLHNVMLDGPPAVLEAARANDKFLDWIESTWTQETITAGASADGERAPHAATDCFAGGELAFYTSLLRRKARFFMLAAGGFSGAWERTGKTAPDGRDFLVTRRRKVIGGMADLAEMASEIGVRFADSSDAETALKHASLRAIVDEVCRAFNAAHSLASETASVRDAEKLVPGFERLWEASRKLLAAVRDIRSAGADDWADQFGDEGVPDIVKEAEFRIRGAAPPEIADDMPESGWEETEKMIGEPDDMTEKERKKEKKRKKKEKEAEEKALAEAEVEAADEAVNGDADITAADGALVVHGAGDEAAAAVATMFGDLLKLDGGDTSELRDPAFVSGSVPGEVTDAAALADAFGAPPPSSTPALGDDYDDDDGGYDDYRARQEEARAVASTGKWAARAGYSGALVLHQTVELAPNKPHPAFCQCALCVQAEVQNAASEAEQRARQGYSDDGRQGGFDSAERNDRKDSGYYDDAGSYESVSYSVDDKQEYQPRDDDVNRDYSPKPVPPPRTAERVLRAEFVVNMKKLRTGDKIGEGAFGVVSKGEYKRETVAIKKMNKKMLASKNAMSEFSNEVLTMCAMSHPNVLKCVAASLTPPSVLLVTEYMKRGTLFDVLYKHRIKLTWSMIRKIALQVAEGMAHMHAHGFLHRDLKSGNILVDTSYNAKIGDFGLAGPPQPPAATGVSGTYQYMAPEILSGEPHSAKSDVYAYGLVLCEMIAGVPPFSGMDAMEAAEQVMNSGARPSIPPHCLRPYASLIQLCWGGAPSSRPDFVRVAELIRTTTK